MVTEHDGLTLTVLQSAIRQDPQPGQAQLSHHSGSAPRWTRKDSRGKRHTLSPKPYRSTPVPNNTPIQWIPVPTVQWRKHAAYHHHHVPEGLGVLSCSLILKMKLVPPPPLRSSRVPSSFRSILQRLFWQSICVHPLYVLQPLFLVLFCFLYYTLCSCFSP